MRTLDELEKRIAFREKRRDVMLALGTPACFLQVDREITLELKKQHAARLVRKSQLEELATK